MMATATALTAQERHVTRDGDTWVETYSGTLPAANYLKVITDMGSVQVEGTNESQISYTVTKRAHAYSEEGARRAFDGVTIGATTQGQTAYLKGEAEDGSYRNFSANFSVRVPRSLMQVTARTGGGSLSVMNLNAKVSGETGGGNIQLDGVNGPVDVTSGGGNVEVGRAGNTLEIETGGGSIHIGSVGGALQARSGGGHIEVESGRGSMELNTGGGSIRVGTCGGDLRAETGGDNIIIGDVAGRADLQTGGGSIRLGSATGPVRAETGGGSLELRGLGRSVEAETGAGSIMAEFTGRAMTESSLETAAGDIKVYLPTDAKVNVSASIDMADGHEIRTEFSGLRVVNEGGDYGPKESWCKGSLNGGGPALRVHTTTGNIDFLRTSATAAHNHK